jgi:hypothetical protein
MKTASYSSSIPPMPHAAITPFRQNKRQKKTGRDLSRPVSIKKAVGNYGHPRPITQPIGRTKSPMCVRHAQFFFSILATIAFIRPLPISILRYIIESLIFCQDFFPFFYLCIAYTHSSIFHAGG